MDCDVITGPILACCGIGRFALCACSGSFSWNGIGVLVGNVCCSLFSASTARMKFPLCACGAVMWCGAARLAMSGTLDVGNSKYWAGCGCMCCGCGRWLGL